MATMGSYLVGLTASLALAASMAGCGSAAGERVLVRVSRAAITEATVDHWAQILAPRGLMADPPKYTACITRLAGIAPNEVPSSRRGELKGECRQQYGSLRQHALEYLISARWLLGEASQRGVAPNEREVERRYGEDRSSSFPGGEGEFREYLKTSGKTPADIMLETKVAMISAKFRRLATGGLPAITRAQAVAYYRAHRQRFKILGRRPFEILVAHSRPLAIKVKHEVEAGKKLAQFGEEQLVTDFGRPVSAEKINAIEKAVLSNRPGTLIGPVVYRRVDFDLIEVKRIIPARYKAFAEVDRAIDQQLAASAYRAALARFVVAWRAKWKSRTHCVAVYVGPKCAGGSRSVVHENLYAFD